MDTVFYKSNCDEVVERLSLLYEHRVQDRIFALFEIPSQTLADYLKKHPEGFCSYPEQAERIVFWDNYLKEKKEILDDSMPGAYLSEFDQGLYGGLVGGDVQFICHDNGWISSMVSPILKDLSEFGSLSYDESHPWFQRYTGQMEIFVEGAGDKFGISHFIMIDGLNFAFELVGATRTYEGLFENPEIIRRVIAFAYDLNVMVQEKFFECVPMFRGGTFSNMVQWIPGRIISESVDPFHMTSVDYFEEWGRENVERIFAEFDGGVLHIHGNGRHLLEAVSTLNGLKAVYLGDDRGFSMAFDVLNELKGKTSDIPLVVSVEYKNFIKKLDRHEVPGGVLYKVTGTPDADTAKKCMDLVRSYRI